MRLRSRLCLLALAGLSLPLTASVLGAQSCFGNASFARNHLQMNGDFVVNNDFEELGASFVSGSNSVFAGLGVSGTAIDVDNSVAIRGTLGYQVPVTRSGSVQICPVLRLGYGLPTESETGLGELSALYYGLGLSIGGELFRRERLAVVPAFSVGVQRDQIKYDGALFGDIEDTYGYGGFALGFVFNDALAVRPSIQFPASARFDDPIIGIGISLNYGGRR